MDSVAFVDDDRVMGVGVDVLLDPALREHVVDDVQPILGGNARYNHVLVENGVFAKVKVNTAVTASAMAVVPVIATEIVAAATVTGDDVGLARREDTGADFCVKVDDNVENTHGSAVEAGMYLNARPLQSTLRALVEVLCA
jgi:hypothetical protein